MDWLQEKIDVNLASPFCLILAACGAAFVLASCLLHSLMRRNSGSESSELRPDEPFRGQAKAKITSLRVYPVKSCAGHEVAQAALGHRGLKMDRLWMVVDGTGRFMTQRRYPKMALIAPSLPASEDQPLLLMAPGKHPIEVPVMRKIGSGGPEAGGKAMDVQIWGDTCRAIDQGDAVAKWLSDFLELEGMRLVRMEDGFRRHTDPAYGTGYHTSFADGFPMLLTAEESLEELNARMAEDEAIEMDRFRPNIVVRGWGAFAEDDWTVIKAAGIAMRTPKPCSRCQVPRINQVTLEQRAEPSATLATFRAGLQVAAWKDSWAKQVFFGVNALHERHGILRVGDTVEPLRVAKASITKEN